MSSHGNETLKGDIAMTRLSRLVARGIVRTVEISRAYIAEEKVCGLEYWVNDMPDNRGWHSSGIHQGRVMTQEGLGHIQARGIVTHSGWVVIAREDMPRVEAEILAEYRRREADPQLVGAIDGAFPVN